MMVAVAAALALSACTSVDCPVNSLVRMVYEIDGARKPLVEPLTVLTKKPNGKDTVLVKPTENTTTFSLPVSYAQPQDIIILSVDMGLDKPVNDTLYISKSNEPHFESVDCSPCFFHTITEVSYTSHLLEDISIAKTTVDYDTDHTHIYLYFRSDD